MSNFQWIRDNDSSRHYDYNLIPKVETPYEPPKKSTPSGFEWRRDNDESLQFEEIKTNKTLILSNGEYKKYSKGSPAVVSNENAIPVMTSNTTPSGEATGQSDGSSLPYKAFDGVDSTWFTSITKGEAVVGYNFPAPKIILRYSIKCRNDSTWGVRTAPKNWTFEGSTDGSVWDVLDTQNNKVFSLGVQQDFHIFNNKQYKYYRLNVSANNDATVSCSVGELMMYESSIPATPPSWQTVSTTLPNSEQFKEEGMEDLFVFDRKVQPVLNSPIQMTSEPLGEGKVFKGKVDLKKYFDLRNLKIK